MPAKGRTAAESLLIGLRSQGFTLRLEDGKLLVSPTSKLTDIQWKALRLAREEIKDILWDEMAPPATDADLRAWFNTAENPPPRNILAVPFDEANDDHSD